MAIRFNPIRSKPIDLLSVKEHAAQIGAYTPKTPPDTWGFLFTENDTQCLNKPLQGVFLCFVVVLWCEHT